MHRGLLTGLSLLLFCSASASLAQESSPERQATAGKARTEPSAEQGPVPVPEPTEAAVRFYRSGNVLWLVNQLWGLAIPALFLFTGLSARIRSWARRLGKKWFFVIVLYVVAFFIINYVIDFTLSYYQSFVRPHAFGLSTQTFGKWFGDSLKSLSVGLVIGALFLWVPYGLLARSPRRWWLYTALLVIPFAFFMQLIAPIWIAPLFNDFGDMKDKNLEASILALAERAGIEDSRVFEVDKSVDTNAVNAYVTGFAGTKRIVLWATNIAKPDEPQLLYVMGHEMGHYVLNHVVKGVLFFSVLILVTLYSIYRISGGLIARYQDRFGFDDLSDIASLPLLILLGNLVFLVITPVAVGFSRYQEHEADRFSLELSHDNYAAASAFVRLQEENLGYPRPGLLFKLWRSTHPPLGERIDFCNTYRPWEDGGAERYRHLFKGSTPMTN